MMDGLARWTEIGRTGGRDPLAMLTAVEESYQVQLSGMSTITNRLRYYAFHCWWISRYADTSPTGSPAAYGDCARRFEFLYALASLCDPGNRKGTSGEPGISGSDHAREILGEGGDGIDFRPATARDTPAGQRYIQPLMGDFKNSYAAQMRDIGLLYLHPDHGLDVPTGRGLALAARFEESLGDTAALFCRIAEKGMVDRDTLARLAPCRPGAIPQDGSEAKMLRDLLLARLEDDPGEVSASQRDFVTGKQKAAMARRDTLLWILDTSRARPEEPVSQEMLRWNWFETAVDATHPRAGTHAGWQHYQCGDSARVACEALLEYVLREMSPAPRDLFSLLAALVRPLEGAGTLGAWLAAIETRQAGETMRLIQARALDGAGDLDTLMGPIARLWHVWGDREPELATAFPEERPGRQTVRHVLRWIERHAKDPAQEAMSGFIRRFIIMRHLAVAAGKFRTSGAYTYLFEIHDRELHWRQTRPVNPSGPRLRVALGFLEDIDLLSCGRITPRGEALLNGAGG